MKNKYYLIGGLIVVMIIGITSLVSAGQKFKKNFTPEMKEAFREKHQEMFENYDVWAEEMNKKADAMEEKANQIRANITEEHFEEMFNIHQLMQEGNYGEVKRLKGEMGHMKGFKQ